MYCLNRQLIRLKNASSIVTARFASGEKRDEFRARLADGPDLGDFIQLDEKTIKEKYVEQGVKLKREKGEPRLRLAPWLKTGLKPS